jgi:hypothetical protein
LAARNAKSRVALVGRAGLKLQPLVPFMQASNPRLALRNHGYRRFGAVMGRACSGRGDDQF